MQCVGTEAKTYNVGLCALSGADLLLQKLPPIALLTLCGLRFSESTSRSSLTRDLSSWVVQSGCLLGFREKNRDSGLCRCPGQQWQQLDQAWANYGPLVMSGPLSFLNRSIRLESIILRKSVKKKNAALQCYNGSLQ